MTDTLRVGVVGAGAIAQAYAAVLADGTVARVVGVADTRAQAAASLAKPLGCPSFDSHTALTDAVDVDAVVICTPPVTHPEIAGHFLDRGLAVLCEKPLAIDACSARAMLTRAERHGALLTMATKFRYVDDVARARSIVVAGGLGEPILVENAFTSRADMTTRWNADPAISGGGVLIDNGTHSVDLIRYVAGPITSVFAIEGRRAQNLAVEDTVRVFVTTAEGVQGAVDLSWSIDKYLDSYLDVHGSEGTLRLGWKASHLRRPGADWEHFGSGYDKLDAFRRQIENFCGAVLGREEPLVTAADAIASVEVVQVAYQSMATDHWVGVEAARQPEAAERLGAA